MGNKTRIFQTCNNISCRCSALTSSDSCGLAGLDRLMQAHRPAIWPRPAQFLFNIQLRFLPLTTRFILFIIYCLMFIPGDKNLIVKVVLKCLAESRLFQLLLYLGVCFRTGATFSTDILIFTLIIFLRIFRFKRRRPRP